MTTLSDVTQEQYDSAEATLIALIRAAYPTLDLRRGTVLRDMLVRPAAAVFAYNSDNLQELQTRMSLINLENSTTPVDPSWVDAILANFMVTRNTGSQASGPLKIVVDGARDYNLASGMQFETVDGMLFATTASYTVRLNANTAAGEIPLQALENGAYYFVVNVTAQAVGTQYSVAAGTAMTPTVALYGFVSAEAYSDFSGGANAETIQEAINRLPAAISYRALESRTSIEAKLRTDFTNIQAISVQGYGDAAQLRDKHNPMGFAVGSRVDLYIRSFLAPSTVVLTKTGTLIGPNTFQFTINRSEAPGFYLIKSISEVDAAVSPGSISGSVPVLGSYAFTEVREADGITGTFHDIDPANGMIETAYSVYQKSTVIVTGVPVVATTHDFKVEVYVEPQLTALQSYVDNTNLRNLEGDYIVRCPLMCMTELSAKIYYSAKNPIDIDKMKQDVYNYINSRHFVGKLTRSELACILRDDGATWVDLSTEGTILRGRIRDAAGTIIALSGDTLDVGTVEDATKLLTTDTVVFATELANINITATPE